MMAAGRGEIPIMVGISGRDDENTATAPYLTRGARHQRTYRRRQRRNKAVLGVEIDYDKFAAALIASAWLTPAQTRDRRNLETAASDIIGEWQRRWRG